MSARVFLGGTLVGELRPSPASGDASFEFDAAYAASASRPVLGRCFEDKLIEPPRTFRGTSVVMDDLSELAEKVRATWSVVAKSAPEVVRERVGAHLHDASLR